MTTARPSAPIALILPTIALAGSVVVTVIGALSTNSATATLNAALTSQTGTAADVYGSQSAIVASSGLVTAGIVGIVVSLALFGALIGFGALSKPAAEAPADEVESIDDDEFDAEPVAAPVLDEATAAEPVAAEPATDDDAAAEPVAAGASAPAEARDAGDEPARA
ncbi:hypothetical protein ACFWGP_09175 [Agromyces sp. NPDC127015]|uniref:hypothetical protein n=1 Tax=Agromyces sp. NPDC127015 TaxID=3347108 RepID=UPI0036523E35